MVLSMVIIVRGFSSLLSCLCAQQGTHKLQFSEKGEFYGSQKKREKSGSKKNYYEEDSSS